MNLQRLHQLYSTDPAAIRTLAAQQGLDPVATLGVVKLLLANDGNLASLSPRQRQCFELAIGPLIAADR